MTADCTFTRPVRARKAHRCCECRVVIEPGTTYTRTSGIWDGRPYSHPYCPPCSELERWAWAQGTWDGEDGRHVGRLLVDLMADGVVSRSAEDVLEVDPWFRMFLEIDPARNYPRLRSRS